ncbi:MAG: M48 family metalloprotease [Candidatus Sumerlaeaceae bacterium]
MSTFGRSEYGYRPRLLNGRMMIALAIALFSIVSYFMKSSVNPVTGKKQHIGVSAQQEMALGLQAAPNLVRQYGGESSDARGRAAVEQVGQRIVQNSDAKKGPYQYEFHLLADPDTINAFALPGGQVFMTEALFRRLTTPGQIAGVLAHEVGHVIGRHGAEQLEQRKLTQGLTGAAVLASYDPRNPRSAQNAYIATMIGQLVNLKYGRGDEIESDYFGVRLMSQAGYDPRSMLKVMEILRGAAKGPRPPEFFSTHPDPGNRLENIQEEIKKAFPSGVPEELEE